MNYNAAKATILERLEKELSDKLTYHSVRHTLDVLRVAEELCEYEQVPPRATQLVKTAALFHDAGFLHSAEQHEWHSCRIAEDLLPRFGYLEEDVARINRMILATRIPQSPRNMLEEILCDADLDYLGRDDFFPIAGKLFAELKAYGILNDEQEWNRKQIAFLEQHHFFTATNLRRRRPKKREHLKQLRILVAQQS
mgnify:CR=1 FL=1